MLIWNIVSRQNEQPEPPYATPRIPNACSTISSRALHQVLLVALVLSTAACGSSGGGGATTGSTGGGGGTGGTAGTSARLEFFQASLDAIDPADPTTVISVDPDATEVEGPFPGALPSVAGTFANNTISDLRVEWIFYARNDGTFQRVSTEAGNGAPTPIRVSSEDMALPVCETAFGVDLADAANARVAYAQGGSDCLLPLTWQLVTLSDDELTDPRDFPGTPLEALYDPNTGAHAGWLSLDGGSLHRLAPDLSTQTPDILVGVQSIDVLSSTGNPFIFLEADQGLYAFNPATNALVDFQFDFAGQCPCLISFATGQDFAFFENDGELFRADPVAGNVVSIDAPSDAISILFGGFSFVTVGSDRVAWSYVADADGSLQTPGDQSTVIRSVQKDGSNPIALDSFPSSVGAGSLFSGITQPTSGDWIFYQTFQGANSLVDPRAVAVRFDDSERREFPGGVWSGTTISTSFATNQLGATERLLRLDGVTDLSDPSNDSLSLSSVNALDPTSAEVALGDLPRGTRSVFSFPGFGPARLGSILFQNGFDIQFDILFWDEEVPGSLRQVTTTNGVNEFTIPLF